jgi:hypothetical protein
MERVHANFQARASHTGTCVMSVVIVCALTFQQGHGCDYCVFVLHPIPVRHHPCNCDNLLEYRVRNSKGLPKALPVSRALVVSWLAPSEFMRLAYVSSRAFFQELHGQDPRSPPFPVFATTCHDGHGGRDRNRNHGGRGRNRQVLSASAAHSLVCSCLQLSLTYVSTLFLVARNPRVNFWWPPPPDLVTPVSVSKNAP